MYEVEKLKINSKVETIYKAETKLIGNEVETKFISSFLTIPGAGFMNRRRLCQLTAAILTSDLTTYMWVL